MQHTYTHPLTASVIPSSVITSETCINGGEGVHNAPLHTALFHITPHQPQVLALKLNSAVPSSTVIQYITPLPPKFFYFLFFHSAEPNCTNTNHGKAQTPEHKLQYFHLPQNHRGRSKAVDHCDVSSAHCLSIFFVKPLEEKWPLIFAGD